MKLSEYIKALNEALKDYGDLDVVYSIDDEGNDYKEVHFIPSVGYYDKKDREWLETADFDMSEDDDIHINSICIN
ncbi:MAG: hypothetical protein DRJ01_00950 [Bacteroidetes bacterium]|nr:MAG: hypothetical protein DRJ01_00950 [Bacteroidota bacterium]